MKYRSVFRLSYDGPEFDPDNPDHGIYSMYIEQFDPFTLETIDCEGSGRRFVYSPEDGRLVEYFTDGEPLH